ncbi:MAG: hypothetical protein QOC87_2127 [Actinomycetota bacterium]|nr:hypothetical protein [Actinomycetota bacterium]
MPWGAGLWVEGELKDAGVDRRACGVGVGAVQLPRATAVTRASKDRTTWPDVINRRRAYPPERRTRAARRNVTNSTNPLVRYGWDPYRRPIQVLGKQGGMKMTSLRRRLSAGTLVALVMAGTVFVGVGPALAAPPPACLDLTPEASSAQTGTVQTISATMRSIQGATPGSGCTQAAVVANSGAVNIDFEIAGPSDPDHADTPASPDLTCDIPVGSSSCTVSYQGASAGTDTVRGWIDQDGSNSTIEADTTEGSCSSAQGDEANCGTVTPGGLTEPDTTDVVTKTWTAPVSLKQLDCVPETQSAVLGATVTVTCTVTNTNNAAVSGQNLDIELTGANDPDSANSPTSPDFSCVTQSNGACSFTHHGTAAGVTTYRAWVDVDNNNATVEADSSEGQDSATTAGATAEPDLTDVVTTTWTGAPATLDCDDSTGPDTERETRPGTGAGDPSGSATYTCTVRDAQGNVVATSTTVSGENLNGINDPDATDGTSYTSPDYSCNTAGGSCSITVTQSESELGTANICFWVGTAAEGQTLCNSETTGENQSNNGTDTGNDLADAVELAWVRATTATRLDCSPETSTSNLGSSVTITCTASNSAGLVSNAPIDIEATGINDPDSANSPTSPDFTCTTSNAGTCTFTHSNGTKAGLTTYRAWIDVDGSNSTTEADASEGQVETSTPGTVAEPDGTDVVTHSWLGPPAKVSISPATDSASVGTCNVFTITATDSADQPISGLTIDVEQIHALAQNSTANDEPVVSFCTPGSGVNPSAVDTTKGDLVESPDNLGTAGGETVAKTGSDGKVTIGIISQPANGSDGTGIVHLTAWYETTDNDDPDTSEPAGTATATWLTPQGRTVTCSPRQSTNATGKQQTFTCVVVDRFGEAIGGEGVTFTESGPGDIVGPTTQTSSPLGQVSVSVSSLEPGAETITATITDDLTGAEPAEVDECDRSAGDPAGAPAGRCADSVTANWTQATPAHLELTPAESQSRPGHDETLTLTVTDAQGQPIAGEAYGSTLDGVGGVASADPFTDANGTARIVLHSAEPGDESISVSTPTCTQPDACTALAVHHWGPARCDIFGTNGSDVLTGTSASEVICGFDGNDRIAGRAGNDTVYGGDGNDYVIGGPGHDSLYGQDGSDTLRGGTGNDALFGGSGDDSLFGGAGPDSLHGGTGSDTLIGGDGLDACRGGVDRDDIRRCERLVRRPVGH